MSTVAISPRANCAIPHPHCEIRPVFRPESFHSADDSIVNQLFIGLSQAYDQHAIVRQIAVLLKTRVRRNKQGSLVLRRQPNSLIIDPLLGRTSKIMNRMANVSEPFH